MRSWVLGANSELPARCQCLLGAAGAGRTSMRATAPRRAPTATSSSTAPPARHCTRGARPGSTGRWMPSAWRGGAPRSTVSTTSAPSGRQECQAKSPDPAPAAPRASSATASGSSIEATANAFLHHMMRNHRRPAHCHRQGRREPAWAARGARGATAPKGRHRPGRRPVPWLRCATRPRSGCLPRPAGRRAPIGYDRARHVPAASAQTQRCPGSRRSCLRASRPSAARARSRRACGSSARPAMRCCTAPSWSATCPCAPSAAITCASVRATGSSASSTRTRPRRSAPTSRRRIRSSSATASATATALLQAQKATRREGCAGRAGRHAAGRCRSSACAFEFRVPRRLDGLGGRRALQARRATTASSSARPLVCFSASGGARMQEALLFAAADGEDRARRCRAWRRRTCRSFSVLTDPTTGGVSASLAMLGDLNLARAARADRLRRAARHPADRARDAARKASSAASSCSSTARIDMIVDRREMRDRDRGACCACC